MGEKKKRIPFEFTPGSWGLEGKSFEKAKAEYYYFGEDLERKLAEIDYREQPENRSLAHLEIDKKYERITEREYEEKILDIQYADDSKEKEKQLLELKKKFNEISETEYEKELCNLKDEPWVGVLNSEFDPNQTVNGLYFELDWNEKFVDMLRENGYTGVSDSQAVENWFNDVCMNEALQEGIIDMDDLTRGNQGNIVSSYTGSTQQRRDGTRTVHF